MCFNCPVWFNVGVESQAAVLGVPAVSSALVSTPDGMVPIGQLVAENAIGREIYDANGVTRIVAVQNNGQKPVWRVNLRNGSFIEATADHSCKAVRERRTVGEWLRVDELQVGMRMHLYPHRARVQRSRKSRRPRCCRAAATGSVLTLEHRIRPTVRTARTRRVAEAALAGWLQADGFVGQYDHGTNRSLTIEFEVANEDEYAWVTREFGHRASEDSYQGPRCRHSRQSASSGSVCTEK